MAVTARCFLGGQGFSAHFADFVPQEKKYVAVIAACPSIHGKLSRSNEEANSLSKEDVIEIEGIVREAMPNVQFTVPVYYRIYGAKLFCTVRYNVYVLHNFNFMRCCDVNSAYSECSHTAYCILQIFGFYAPCSVNIVVMYGFGYEVVHIR